MPHSLSKVYVHIVFSTKNRVNYIDEAIEDELFKYIGGICNRLKCQTIQVGGYKNHVHILCQISREMTQSKLLKEIKQYSSKWIKTKGVNYENFYWQNGYGIFSVGSQGVEIVKNYILNQKKHHRAIEFKKEFRMLLKKYDLEYDEKYVWD